MKHKLAWLLITCPDICAAANLFSQITMELYGSKHIKAIKKVIRKVQMTRSRGLRFHKLIQSSLRIVAICDASFAKNPDLSSKFGI